ncbi:MAG: FHA domain-containing protein [Planctomycetaceae bacterium]|jgi:pSer/pThr/pTyr-binding forkhead associated (FHA) protein|nr:FHA domain-containing protein [Planctomycetaceae bacterium]MBT7257192.1 FHA domain-containing protein [Planctomycetaceae bacterium]
MSELHPVDTSLTLRVLDGADRGHVYQDLDLPITVGREEGNDIQLNDERISRFHSKIQLDHDRMVLTDLGSTNGTKVNGEDIQLRILRYGDLIAVGRSVLLFGSREQIAKRLQDLRLNSSSDESVTDNSMGSKPDLGFELNCTDDTEIRAAMNVLDPPGLPERLSPGQAAQLADLMSFLHIRMRSLIQSASENGPERMVLSFHKWQSLIDLQSRLAEYIRQISNPE